MKAKVFTHGSNELENLLNEWLLTAGKIKICYQITSLVYDLYACIAPQVCNQWWETTVYYEEAV